MIYDILLRSSGDILIPSDQFKRNTRSENSKSRGTYGPCGLCGRSFASRLRYRSHRFVVCRVRQLESHWGLAKFSRKTLGLCPSILRTCRLVHLEASPTLYRSNSFRFEDAATLNCFRWSTDIQQAVHLQRIHIQLPKSDAKAGTDQGEYVGSDAWWNYLTGPTFSLAKDFPHLKGLALTLGRGLAVSDAATITSNFQLLVRNMYRLDWIQIIGLNDETLLELLMPIVKKSYQNNSNRVLRTKITEYDMFVGWKNAVVWWGLPGEQAPSEIQAYAGDRRYRHRLFRIINGNEVSYTSGHSFLE
ncbi:hypothetical protein MMC28_004325 [Mycoblastus sanguinarius]|nr:hypothetical protein [Mycoblastus sanguinarius]